MQPIASLNRAREKHHNLGHLDKILDRTRDPCFCSIRYVPLDVVIWSGSFDMASNELARVKVPMRAFPSSHVKVSGYRECTLSDVGGMERFDMTWDSKREVMRSEKWLKDPE
ncbi:hypothetical protein FZEAL_4884 [Fusarium zealandicum]|uniref:Uncharacterized protein n=1 Tax=Fusarium zealandicum TaxID=1053134 RepID=A0A8H4ULV4_9HYPO|nr:hypothetical protein FZEAL_4884 [Fusarium zealandicum]